MFDPTGLQDILAQQKELLDRLTRESKAIEQADLTKENERLKKELTQVQHSLEEKSAKLNAAVSQNKALKNALFEQIYNEKIAMLDVTHQKRRIYFSDANRGADRLTQLELALKHRTDQLAAQLDKCSVETRDDIVRRLNELTIETRGAVVQAKAQAQKAYNDQAQFAQAQFDALKNEQITDQVVQAVGKKNNLEAFVGGNLINKVGIIFIILGIITISRLAYLQMSDVFRAAIMFAISGLFLVAGEVMNRKKPGIFSLGLTSIGVAGLYISLAVSYFGFEIIGMLPALALCVAVTAAAFVLSTRYNSQTIAAFALVGGYIPTVAIGGSAVLIYSAMGYFVVLNLLALLLSFYKKWRIAMFIGFTLNLWSTGVIIAEMDMLWRVNRGAEAALTIVYVLFAFAVYTVIPILSSYRTKRAFGAADVILLALNTVISSIIMYVVLWLFDLSAFHGVMSLGFAAVYVTLGWAMGRLFTNERYSAALFYITGLTFVVLFVPLQFDIMWLSLGWLVQGTLLSCYGILKAHRPIKYAGYIIGGLCLAVFWTVDLAGMDWLFSYRYLAVTAASLIVLAALVYKQRQGLQHGGERAYKYAALLNSWVYALYLVSLCGDFVRRQLAGTYFDPLFLLFSMGVAVTFLFAAFLPRIPLVADKGVKIMSLGLSILGMVGLWGYTLGNRVVEGTPPVAIMVLATAVLVAMCLLALVAMYRTLMFFVVEAKMSVEWLPFGVSAYFLVILTQNLVSQYNMAVTSMALSIIFVTAALVWIIFGFVRRFVFMRRFGLALSIMAVAKLFLVDLPSLTGGYRIISYFAFGAALLGISFVYQYFSKQFALKLDIEESAETHE
ncbi:MAG: DUF2339 domain-containing protein [Defluviitaleaceae bacterium]|nr:DUF2339 domain-containing protein [Defluviitaleaceae bacterium]